MIPDTYEDYTNYMLIQRIMCLEHQVADKMTVRDEFAKAVATGMAKSKTEFDIQIFASYCYAVADAMMEARRGD